MKHIHFFRGAVPVLLFLMTGCGMVTKEVFTINPDLSGKCVIEAKMYLDTTGVDAALVLKDSSYGITKVLPDYHKLSFSRKDAMVFALKIINTPGVEIWNSIRYGVSKKRDMIYFSGTAYFRNIRQVHFSMLDSALKVSEGADGEITFSFEPPALPASVQKISDEEASKKVGGFMKSAFYIRPILTDRLNPTMATVIYNLPGNIVHSSGLDQQGNQIVQLTLTGNEILKYADSLAKNQQLAMQQFKSTNGTNTSVIGPVFDKIIWGMDSPPQVTFKKGDQDQFDYSAEEQNALGFFDYFMEHSGLQKFDSTSMIKEEHAEEKRPEEYGKLVINKVDSAARKPYFSDMTAKQSHDTITFSGELSKDIKTEPEGKIHIQRITTGNGDDITDSIVSRNKITAEVLPEHGDGTGEGPKRKVGFIVIVHFPPGCKELSVMGRLSVPTGKRNTEVPFKINRVAVKYAKKG